MRQLRKLTLATLAGVGALAIAAAPGLADSKYSGAMDKGPVLGAAPQVQLAHMGGGRGAQGRPGSGMMGSGQGYGPGPGYGMGPGQGYGPGPCYGMGPGKGYGPGQGYGMGHGMMGPGYGMGPGQGYGMGHGQGYGMGPGMMGPGYGMGPGQGYGMGPGMMGPGYSMGPAARSDLDLSADDVRARIEGNLTWRGNKRLKVGDVTETDDDTVTADIVTQDGSLVQRFKVDRHSGRMQQAE